MIKVIDSCSKLSYSPPQVFSVTKKRERKKMKLISGNANLPLAQSISDILDIPLTQAAIKRFSDKEIFVEILENIRGEDVFLIQPTCYPANDNVMELLIILDALKRGSARRITAVLPYYGYARQDRKTGPRTPISAKLLANLITTAGANRVLTMDLHAGQIQGFFDVPVDNLYSAPLWVSDIEKRMNGDELIMVSPDVGGVLRTRSVAKRLGIDLAIIDKRREKAGVSEVMNVIGDVKGKTCIMVDDIVDSGGTLINASDALIANGANKVYSYVTHGVFSGSAIERIESSSLQKMIVTDSIPATPEMKKSKKVEQISVAPLLGDAILRIADDRSVSALFK